MATKEKVNYAYDAFDSPSNPNSTKRTLSGGSSSSSKSINTLETPDYTSQIEDLKKAQLSASMASLDKQKNTSLSNLSAEKATIEPAYQKSKIQAGVTAKQTARSFDEYMAQRGGGAAKSGIAGQGALLNNMAFQRQYGELDQAEKSDLSNIARRETDINNSYASDVQSAQAGIEAQSLQNYLNQMNLDRTYNQQNYQFDTTTGMQREQNDRSFSLSQQTADANNAMTYAQLNEMQNPNSVTNQMKQIGLDTARLNYQALPDQLKAQAQKIAQDLAMGAISQQAAQLQLDYLPQQLKLGLAQTQAQINASNRAGTSSGGSSASNLSALKYANEMGSQQALASSMQGLQSMASDGKTRSEILKFINANAADLQANGVPVQDLYSWANKNFTWDKQNGEWYNTAEDD